MQTYVYDIETYPNCFQFGCTRRSDGATWFFEISSRRDDSQELYAFLSALRKHECRMAGFNNINFDYPVVHEFIKSEGRCGYQVLYAKAQSIINSYDNFGHLVWESDWFIPQVDLFKINHFDNKAKSTGLKQIEFNMRVPDLLDLPFPPGTMLDNDQMDVLSHYLMHGDIVNTVKFYDECVPAIEFREKLSMQYDRNFMNHNDTKIGKDYFIMELEKAGIPCFTKEPGQGKKPIQTKRAFIPLRDAVFPYIAFSHPEFQRIHQWFLNQTITETVGVFEDISCTVNNFKYDFGLGGIHGSVDSQIIYSDDEWIIEDWDVKSYYPNLAIKNKVYPAHLGPEFCKIYDDKYQERIQYKKGTPENAVLKLALNGVYGDSNNPYSPFYDPLYTMTITINGQLLLCMLAEMLAYTPGLQMIQINTDGLTIRYPRVQQKDVHAVCNWWQQLTQLELENVEYKRMMIRDVNNYIGEYTDGKLKRKGCYEYKREHHQNHSVLVVPKIAEKALVHGVDIESAVRNHTDVMDFMLRVKAGRGDHLLLDDVEQQKTCRYYVSTEGGIMVTKRPPVAGKKGGDYKKSASCTESDYARLNVTGIHNPAIHTKNKSVYGETRTEVEKGWKVTVCNDITQCINPINYDYYIDRVKKIVEPLRNT